MDFIFVINWPIGYCRTGTLLSGISGLLHSACGMHIDLSGIPQLWQTDPCFIPGVNLGYAERPYILVK
jgi:hypothetical protein